MLSPYRTPHGLLAVDPETSASSPVPVLEELGLALILVVILAVDLVTFSVSGVDAAIGLAALFVAHQALSSVRRHRR